MSPTAVYYPRFFIWYATDHGVSESQRLNDDTIDHPLNPLINYLSWVTERLNEFKTHSPNLWIGETLINTKKFEAWLHSRWEMQEQHKKWAMK